MSLKKVHNCDSGSLFLRRYFALKQKELFKAIFWGVGWGGGGSEFIGDLLL
jgi:hypothetical protein